MGDAASAIPGHLLTYSGSNTGRADDLYRWISSVLTPAIGSYRAGAVEFGHDIGGITVGTETIDAATTAALARAKLTDERVKFTAIAFQEAGTDGGAPMTRTVTPVPYLPGKAPVTANPLLAGNGIDWNGTVVHTTGAALDQESQKDGARVAGQFEQYFDSPHGPDYKGFLALLGPRADDPAFAAGFFNALPPARLTALLQYRSYSNEYNQYGQQIPPVAFGTFWQTFASALGSGRLDPKNEQLVVAALLAQNKGGDLTIPALQAIAANPAAAKAFVGSLYDGTLPADTVQKLFASTAEQRALIQVFTTDLKTDPADADRLFKTVNSLLITLPDGLDPTDKKAIDGAQLKVTTADLREIQPDLTEFLQAYIAGKLGPAPKDEKGLQAWAQQLGVNLRALAPFYHGIVNTANKEMLDAAKANEFAKGFLVTVLLAGPAETLAPEDVAYFGWKFGDEFAGKLAGKLLLKTDKTLMKLAFGGTAGGAVYQAEPPITKFLFGEKEDEPADQELQGVLRNYAALYMAQQLYQKGMIVDAEGRTITWDEASGGGGLEGLLARIGKDISVSKWANKQYFKNPDGGPHDLLNLGYLLDAVLAAESTTPGGG